MSQLCTFKSEIDRVILWEKDENYKINVVVLEVLGSGGVASRRGFIIMRISLRWGSNFTRATALRKRANPADSTIRAL